MSDPRICIFGTGAIGSLLAVRLALSGARVSVIARGEPLAAMRGQGIRLVAAEGEVVAHPHCTDDPATLGEQDVVVLTVKAPTLPVVAETIQPLLGPDASIVSAANGVPWWYFYRHGGTLAGHRLDSVDPGGRLWEKLSPARVIGCVIYAVSEMVAPGVIRGSAKEFRLGDPGGALREKTAMLSAVLERAGLSAPVRDDIRQEIWTKLWGNLAFNPLSLLTGELLDRLTRDEGTREVARRMMVEAQAVGEALGIKFPMTVAERLAIVEATGPHKTSMLQDLERGRSIEIDAILGAVVEMAGLVNVPVPTCKTILALTRQRGRVVGCYPA
jgi:2-dehydropantoate 2-reductase